MISENEYILSFYEPLSAFGNKDHIELCKNTATGKFYVKKTLSIYDRAVFEFIRSRNPQNVPKIVEILEDGKELIIIEEYLPGQSLREMLEERGALPETEVLRITAELVQILLPSHEAAPPIVHRDIKPENLILSTDGVLKLVDFNAAKVATPEKRRDTELFGTAGYAAPEQYGFAASSPATDIYAIGMLITELSTGGMDPKKVPAALHNITEKCTRMDPETRYKNVRELLSDLLNISALPMEELLSAAISSEVLSEDPEEETPGKRPRFLPLSDKRSWLPPGFRTQVWWKMVIALHGYALILFLTYAGGSTMNTFGGRLVEYAFVLLPSIFFVLVDFNYRDVWSHLPLLRSDKLALRILGLILYPVIAFLSTWFFLILISMTAGIDLSTTAG